MANKVFTEILSEPLDGAKTATVDIDSDNGNLMIDGLTDGRPVLASGALQYLESQGPPAHTLASRQGQATLTLRGGHARQSWFRLPWTACLGATDWRVHLNPTIVADITAHSGGGNVKLDLAGMAATRVAADTGGGNLDLALPDHAANLSVTARTGAGNVTVDIGAGIQGTNVVDAGSGAGNVVVRIPADVAARIHATSGLGKVIVDPRFRQIDKHTYESPDYDGAARKVEFKLATGAGNVSVSTR